jgi:hypothetical protein
MFRFVGLTRSLPSYGQRYFAAKVERHGTTILCVRKNGKVVSSFENFLSNDLYFDEYLNR